MSIVDKLSKLQTDITNAYSSISSKGGTIPANKNTQNLASAIDSITSGGGTVYVVTFDSNGGTAVMAQAVASGGTATEPPAPTHTEYNFVCWTLNGVEYNFSMPVTADITLVASWKEKEYTQVEYITSTGTQYIDTLYIVSSEKVKYEIKMMLTSNEQGQALWGQFRTDKTSMIISTYIITTGRLRFFVGGTDGLTSIDYTVSANTLYELSLEANNGTFTRNINNSTQTATYSGPLNKTDAPLIFAQRNGTTGTVEDNSKIKLYSFKISDNDVLVRDYIPVIRNSDNKAGLLDRVNNVFYPNAGTGSFLTGAVVGLI